MKYIILISFSIVCLLLYNSCNDSLGIEPNVLKTKLNGNPIDTTHKDTTQKSVKVATTLDSIYFYEEFYKDSMNVDRVSMNNPNIVRNNCFADTAVDPPNVWIDLRIENRNDEYLYQLFNRTIYTKVIQFIADSFPAKGNFRLNGSGNSGYWSEIICKKVGKPDSLFFSGTDTRLEIEFTEQSKKAIKVRLNAQIPNQLPDARTLILVGEFKIIIP